MKTFTIFILVMITTAITNFAQTMPSVEAGISQSLAKWRAANYSDVRYKLNITLEKGAALMTGDLEIRVNLTEEGAKNDLILDWRTTQFATDKDKPFADVVSVNQTVMGKATQSNTYDYQTLKEHLLISRRFFKAGENTIKIKFASPIKTSGAAITRYVDKEDGAEYVYSLFVPSDASTAFPVFDQPDLKARFQLNVRPPQNWSVVSNTDSYKTKMDPMDSGSVNFEETKPISTYVFAFAAGNFEVFNERTDENAISKISEEFKSNESNDWLGHQKSIRAITRNRIYIRKSQAEKFKQHAAEVFRLNREGVKFLESWFDYKFPFPKYDLVLIPEFPFGGMEHAGATFLREDRVIFPTEPTKNDYITRANVIFHEAAHQWFGDTVTMRWFDDLWLKEGFAEFMAYKTLEKVMPEYNAWKIFYERNKQAAYLTDSTRGTTPIYQEISNLSAAKSAYGNIVYRKAPSFLRQAEFYLGEDKFQTAVRAFLKKHEFANAEWTDLVKEFGEVEVTELKTKDYYQKFLSAEERQAAESSTRKETNDWANVWVKTRGIFKFSLETKPLGGDEINGGKSPIAGYIISPTYRTDFPENSSVNLLTKFKALVIYKDGTRSVENFETVPNKIPNPDALVTKEIAAILPNYQDYGYGIFLLDEKSRAYVLANIQTEKDDFLRTMMWGSLWDSVREAELPPQDYVALVIKNLELGTNSRIPTSAPPVSDGKPPVFPETDESTINTLLGRVGIAINYYLNDEQRKELTPKLEEVLRTKILVGYLPMGERITAFRAFVNLASTAESRIMLKSILEVSRVKITNPPASVSDRLIDIPPLRTKDRFDIVTKLLILGDEDAPRLLAELEKTETTDEAKRYAYTAKAGIATAENKAKFWNDFVSNKDISESWIESAFVSFNSPRHSELTLPYLEKALAELPNLKRNRKIFFINGWLAAFIGGQKSEQALAIVNKFLVDNPNLDKDLRLKILENADGLERAVKIRQKFSGAK